jgi:DNA-binding response OmpR family regulator
MAKILLVEDEEAFLDMVDETLRQAGHETIVAREGKEALRLYDPKTIDIVLTDLIMPDIEGLALIAELVRLNAGVRIIAMSGGGMGGTNLYFPAALSLGAVHVLAKPFSNEQLLSAVNALLAP